MNSLVSELVKVTTTERLVLEQCKDILSTLSAMQVSLAMLSILISFVSELAFDPCLFISFLVNYNRSRTVA